MEMNRIFFKKIGKEPDGRNIYNFHFEYNNIVYQTTLRTKKPFEDAIKEATKTLQFELMHSIVSLLNWKEENNE